MAERTDTTARPDTTVFRDAILVAIAAFFGRLPALGAWWNQDDWSLLARASGLLHEGHLARLVSRDLYWRLGYPLFGLDPAPWAVTRLLLHACAALLVSRLTRRGGFGRPAALGAGLLFAATPLAFTPLYWASGVQELLGATFALLAVDCFLSQRRWAPPVALLAGLLALLSKESALLLPVWLGVVTLLGDRERRPVRLPVVALLLAAAVWEATRVWAGFAHGPGAPYALTDAGGVAVNLTRYGWWLLSPGPFFADRFTLLVGLGGLALWVLWSIWAQRAWRAGERAPAATLLGALTVLAPALLLAADQRPHLAYAAAAPLTIGLAGAVLGRRVRIRSAAAVLLTALAISVSWGFMEARTSARDADGLPSDLLVRRTSVSFQAIQQLGFVPYGKAPVLTLYQPTGLLTRAERVFAERGQPAPTLLHRSLGGTLGPTLAGPQELDVRWAVDLDKVNLDGMVLADVGALPLYWGPTTQAYLYAAMTDLGLGRLEEAARHLHTGLRRSETTIPFAFNEGQLPVTLEQVKTHAEDFIAFLPSARVPEEDKAQLVSIARDLLERCGAL